MGGNRLPVLYQGVSSMRLRSLRTVAAASVLLLARHGEVATTLQALADLPAERLVEVFVERCPCERTGLCACG